MEEEQYRRERRTTLPRSLVERGPRDRVDAVIAVASCIALDALAFDDISVEVHRSDDIRRWAFERELMASTTVAELLDAASSEADGTTPTVTVVVREGDEIELHVTEVGRDCDVAPDAFTDLLTHIAREIVDDPDRAASRVPLVGAEQQHWLLETLNDVRMPYPDAARIDELVLHIAARTPDAVAIEDDGVRVSYAELVERARAIAAMLRDAAVRPGEAIAVMFPRGVECVAAMLGVLLAGAVYVPIAVDEPETRRERLLDLLSVRVFFQVGASDRAQLTLRAAEGQVFLGEDPDDRGGAPLYVMFTSGSTGDPKAVVVSHRSVIRLVLDPWFVGFAATDTVGFASNPGFDATTWEVWGALANGARLAPLAADVVVDAHALEDQLARRGVTCLFLTTSLFNAHARSAPAMFGTLRVLGIGGEAADPSTCRMVLASTSPPGALLNAYGPTESTTFASWHEITDIPDGARRVPIGSPIANTTLHVLDRHRRLVPAGVPGELYIGGDGLALGYFGDPELTACKFVADPFAGVPHRLYASGDLVVRDESGAIVFLRRIDDQLKIRGFRVEPVEIEAAIRSIEGVTTAVVLPRSVDGRPRLVAYVVAESQLEAAAIRDRLRRDLPAYLVPSRVLLVDELPLTRSGKLDRARLPDPFASPTGEDRTLRSVTEADIDDDVTGTVVDIWRDVLRVQEVTPEQSFFDCGGDSLLAVRLYGAVRRRFGIVLPSGTIDDDFTLEKFVVAVRVALAGGALPMVTEMNTVDGPLVVLTAPGGGEVDRYRWLASALGDSCHVVALREPGHYGTEPRPRTASGVAIACRQALRESGFDAPVAIIGECSGGLVAHQLACDLARTGHRTDLVVLLDTPVPGGVGAKEPPDVVNKLAGTLRRRGRNAIALARLQTQWTWYQTRRQPVPAPLAVAMTVRANGRRLRDARPSFFDGHVLYVQAVDGDGATETEGAPEYWSRWARSSTVVTAPGSHAGSESFLSRANAGVTARAIVTELEHARRSSVE